MPVGGVVCSMLVAEKSAGSVRYRCVPSFLWRTSMDARSNKHNANGCCTAIAMLVSVGPDAMPCVPAERPCRSGDWRKQLA
jgi:hypothetical protein